MELWVATANSHKLEEIRHILNNHTFEIHSTAELEYYTSPLETGKTFTENARIKAKTLKAVKLNAWILADDSGLEVEGLNNMPGVHSARYAGEKARDSENTAKSLKMMSLLSATYRKAQFRCCLVLIDPNGHEHIFEGILLGEISRQQRGQNGFGYDNIFIPQGGNKTLAELTPAEKNKISHRAQALRKLKEQLFK